MTVSVATPTGGDEGSESAAVRGLSWALACGAPMNCHPTEQARGQPGPDQAKVSPEHRAKTFLDGAVAEGPIDPYPLRPESPPKLMEMIQFLPGAAADLSLIIGKTRPDAGIFELATSLYSAAKLASIARIAEMGHSPSS